MTAPFSTPHKHAGPRTSQGLAAPGPHKTHHFHTVSLRSYENFYLDVLVHTQHVFVLCDVIENVQDVSFHFTLRPIYTWFTVIFISGN